MSNLYTVQQSLKQKHIEPNKYFIRNKLNKIQISSLKFITLSKKSICNIQRTLLLVLLDIYPYNLYLLFLCIFLENTLC
jgi:hypothetical protein